MKSRLMVGSLLAGCVCIAPAYAQVKPKALPKGQPYQNAPVYIARPVVIPETKYVPPVVDLPPGERFVQFIRSINDTDGPIGVHLWDRFLTTQRTPTDPAPRRLAIYRTNKTAKTLQVEMYIQEH